MPKNLGALERIKDPNEQLLGGAEAYTPWVNLPDDSWLVTNFQGETAFCGEHAGTHFISVLEHASTGAVNRYSPRYGVIKLKTPGSSVNDGFSVDAGTTLPAVFKWLEQIGADSYEPLENDVLLPETQYCDPTVVTPAMDSDAENHKVKNFAYDALTFNALCQAVDQYKAVIVLIKCDDGFWGTATPTFTTPEYGHFVVIDGHSETALRVIDSADPNPEFRIKMVDQKYVTSSFFIESGTAIEPLPIATQVVTDAAQVVQDVAVDTQTPPAEKETILEEIKEVVEKIETVI